MYTATHQISCYEPVCSTKKKGANVGDETSAFHPTASTVASSSRADTNATRGVTDAGGQ